MSLCKQDIADIEKLRDGITYYVDQTPKTSALLTEDEMHALWDARDALAKLSERIERVLSGVPFLKA